MTLLLHFPQVATMLDSEKASFEFECRSKTLKKKTSVFASGSPPMIKSNEGFREQIKSIAYIYNQISCKWDNSGVLIRVLNLGLRLVPYRDQSYVRVTQ